MCICQLSDSHCPIFQSSFITHAVHDLPLARVKPTLPCDPLAHSKLNGCLLYRHDKTKKQKVVYSLCKSGWNDIFPEYIQLCGMHFIKTITVSVWRNLNVIGGQVIPVRMLHCLPISKTQQLFELCNIIFMKMPETMPLTETDDKTFAYQQPKFPLAYFHRRTLNQIISDTGTFSYSDSACVFASCPTSSFSVVSTEWCCQPCFRLVVYYISWHRGRGHQTHKATAADLQEQHNSTQSHSIDAMQTTSPLRDLSMAFNNKKRGKERWFFKTISGVFHLLLLLNSFVVIAVTSLICVSLVSGDATWSLGLDRLKPRILKGRWGKPLSES